MEKIEDIHHLRRLLASIGEQPKEAQLALLADLGKRSLFFLAWNILGFKDIDATLHWDMCKQWEHEARDKLFLCPRGTFKTSIFTISGSIYEIINNPDIRILISNATLSNAKAILKGIKDHFIHNETFRALYPEFCPPTGDGKKQFREFGTQEEFRVMNQRPGIRESTIEVNSVDGNVVSRHYELHIGDDLVNDKNVTTKDQIDKVESFIRAAYSLLEPGVGRNILIGTRWHYDDPYGRIIESKGSRGYLVYERRILEKNKDGKEVSIFPKRFTPGEINKIKKQQGAYMFSCTPEETPILMADWSFKPISEVKVGDKVVGFEAGNKKKKNKMVVSEVLAKGSRKALVYKLNMDSGRYVRCTEDHEWYTSRNDKSHRPYKPAKVGSKLMHVVNAHHKPVTHPERDAYAYLAGILDGEGACKHGAISISQCPDNNPEVHARIKRTLDFLNIPYDHRENDRQSNTFVLSGGRNIKINILKNAKPAKSGQIIDNLWKRPGMFIQEKDTVVSMEADSFEDVYSMETTTGNYIAWGYASKNCQYLNDPLPEEDQVFKKDWIKYYDLVPRETLNRLWIVTSIDPAVSGTRYADMSAIVTVGVDHNDDIYVLEVINQKLDTSGLIEAIFAVNARWNPVKIGVETFAFQKTIKNVIEWEMRRKKVYFPLVPLETDTTRSKEARIRGLQPRIQYSNFYVKRDMYDLVDQMLRFPRAKHDDIIDALANAQQMFRTPGYRPVPKSLSGETFNGAFKKLNKQRHSKRIGRDHLMES